MRELPSGTVTLLFTDIAGSTRLLNELGDGYAAALATHRRAVRELIATHGGVEVDTQGDSFFLAFGSAADAVRAATEMQAALRDGPIRIRIGIHTGEPMATDEGYVGIDVNRGARIAAAGHGGQILVSHTTRDLLGGSELRDLGEHLLKDVGRLRLYQLGVEEFPPPRSLSQMRLPAPSTPLLGRDDDLAGVIRLVSEARARLVTITGPGGVGKTRLALEAAAELAAEFDDGAAFVDLSGVRDATLVESAIAATLGTPGDLSDQLREQALLLVLDNFEQVIQAAADVARLLELSPRLTILVTSREPLRLRLERQHPLQALGDAPAVDLFRERALAIDPRFDEPDERLAELCERLERMPLAIELAAARVNVLRSDELLVRLDRRLQLLTAGARDAPERQRTLRATIEWSYELLDDRERQLFRRLAVFAGGWTLAAAEDVADADLDTLQSLVDKSLAHNDGARFRLLETIREYALERLEDADEADSRRRRHAEYYLAFAREAEPRLTGRDQTEWLDSVAAEVDNLHAALDWCASTPDAADEGLQLASALVLFWFIRGLYRDGLHWLTRLLQAETGPPSAARAAAIWGRGLLLTLVGDEAAARPQLEEALRIGRELGDDSRAARALIALGLLAFFRNDMAEARSLFEEGAVLARRAGDRWCLADALGTLGSIYPLQGEFDRADEVASEGLAIAREDGDRQGIRMCLFALALVAARRGDLAAARVLSEEGLAISREIGDLWFVSYFLWILATVASESGDSEPARAYAEESLAVARRLEGPLLLVCALDALAQVERLEGNAALARRHLDEAEQIGRNAPVPDSYVSSVLTALGELALGTGDVTAAVQHLDESLALARHVGDTWAEARVVSAKERLATARGDLV